MSSNFFQPTPVAESVPFDNTTNGFTSDNVQTAIEEVRNLSTIPTVNTAVKSITILTDSYLRIDDNLGHMRIIGPTVPATPQGLQILGAITIQSDAKMTIAANSSVTVLGA